MPRIYESQGGCKIAATLNIVGDRWTILVLRDLFQGRRRFNDLLESLEGISPNLLADRLKRLEKNAIVTRVLYSEHPPRAEYHLTEKGKALEPVIEAMRDWGKAYVGTEDAVPVA